MGKLIFAFVLSFTAIWAFTDMTREDAPISGDTLDTWSNAYTFSETQADKLWNYHLLLTWQGDNSYAGELRIDGFELNKQYLVDAQLVDNRMMVFLADYGEDNVGDAPEEGALLFVLEEKAKDGHSKIITHWKALKPVLPQSPTTELAFKR